MKTFLIFCGELFAVNCPAVNFLRWIASAVNCLILLIFFCGELFAVNCSAVNFLCGVAPCGELFAVHSSAVNCPTFYGDLFAVDCSCGFSK
jgi:uncharacterized membrane protein YgdD (TMEM256/DUF423 family)